MSGYALAHLHSVDFGPEIIEYLQRIDATLDEFGGRFIVHGNPVEVREGDWPGDLVIIEFPDLDQARAWYVSPAYEAIAALRTDNSVCDLVLVGGVGPGYRAAKALEGLAH